jgi:uncharacterized protein YutE (UPF0331/DUF86 family)
LVKPEVIENRIKKLQDYLGKLLKLKSIGKDEFVSDFRNSDSAKYLLQVSIECCLDIANHIIASEKYRSPEDYADSFRVLHEREIVPDSLINRMVEMAKFRNRIVHVYWEVDEDLIYDIIQNNLSDFELFIQSVLNVL